MRRCASLLRAIFAAACLPAAAGSLSQGFHVTVSLNGASGVKIEAPVSAAVPVAGDAHSVTVSNALVIRTFRAQALRLRLEIVDPAVRSVDVLGLGKPLHLGRDARSLLVRSEGAEGLRSISYVVHYGKDDGGRRSVPLLATIVP